jgi:hypothetical protein
MTVISDAAISTFCWGVSVEFRFCGAIGSVKVSGSFSETRVSRPDGCPEVP